MTVPPRIAFVEITEFDENGIAHVHAPLSGRYLHADGVKRLLEAEAEAWDEAAAAPAGAYQTSPEACAEVAASLRMIVSRSFGPDAVTEYFT